MADTIESQVEKRPRDHKLRLELAAWHAREGRKAEAVTAAEEAAQLNWRYHPWLVEVGQFLMDIGAEPQAEIVFGNAVRLAPHSLAALNGYGRALTLIGKIDDAQRAHELALQQAPNDYLTQMLLANIVGNPRVQLEQVGAEVLITFRG